MKWQFRDFSQICSRFPHDIFIFFFPHLQFKSSILFFRKIWKLKLELPLLCLVSQTLTNSQSLSVTAFGALASDPSSFPIEKDNSVRFQVLVAFQFLECETVRTDQETEREENGDEGERRRARAVPPDAEAWDGRWRAPHSFTRRSGFLQWLWIHFGKSASAKSVEHVEYLTETIGVLWS